MDRGGRRTLTLAWLAALLLGACSSPNGNNGTPEPKYLQREQLLDPRTCEECHGDHYREWSGSMHAYAAEDPVFRAMNARGQRETNGELGAFCVNCHAPMAVIEGATTDGLNLDEVPSELKGVTCYFCHSVDGVEGTHNNPLRVADDLVMRGGYRDPVPNEAHRSAYSPLHDRNDLESAKLCGSCHDIVTPAGAHVERTFEEWQGTLFSHADGNEPLSCGNCHMRGRDGIAADYEGVVFRRVHDHSMPGVDLALTDWPEREAQRELVQRSLNTSLLAELCVYPDSGRATVSLENVAAGHSFPSGAAQDRRVWVELMGWEGDQVVFESGNVGDDEAVLDKAADDPNLWWLGDRIFDADGNVTHSFWEAADYESNLLPGPTARSPLDPDYIDPHVVREYAVPLVDRVTLRVRMRPMGLDVLRDFVKSGDLDERHLAEMPAFTLASTQLEWRLDSGATCVPAGGPDAR